MLRTLCCVNEASVSAEPVRDQRIARALRFIREAPGTVYSRDLYEMLDVLPGHGPASTTADDEVLAQLNSWFSQELVTREGTGSRSLPGMVEFVTVIEFRTFLDFLLDHVSPLTQQGAGGVPVHPDGVREVRDAGPGMVEVRMSYPDLAIPGEAQADTYREWANTIQQRYRTLVDSEARILRRVDQETWNQMALASGSGGGDAQGLVEINLDDCYVEDVDFSVMLGASNPVRFRARHAVFAGHRIGLGQVEYAGFDVSWSVFVATTVSVQGATFTIDPADADPALTVQWRDSTFCSSVRRICFDEIVVGGATRALSFEDSQIRGARMTFYRGDLGRATLDFYQTKFLDGTTVEFVETDMANAGLRFVDATLIGGAVVFYRVTPMPPSDFLFREAEEVRIENCSVDSSVRFANIKKMSLGGSAVSTALLVVVPHGDVAGDIGQNKFWFLDAIEHGRTPDDELDRKGSSLAAQFAAVKEVFHTMGEYDLEDEAFVRHMRFKKERPLGRYTYRMLDHVGRFGTSPRRMVFSLLWVFCAFALLNWLLMVTLPSHFNAVPHHAFVAGAVAAAAQLVQASGPVGPATSAMTLVFLAESVIGWFFLGYLLSGFVRKTLR